jgi:hypothetical protein
MRLPGSAFVGSWLRRKVQVRGNLLAVNNNHSIPRKIGTTNCDSECWTIIGKWSPFLKGFCRSTSYLQAGKEYRMLPRSKLEGRRIKRNWSGSTCSASLRRWTLKIQRLQALGAISVVRCCRTRSLYINLVWTAWIFDRNTHPHLYQAPNTTILSSCATWSLPSLHWAPPYWPLLELQLSTWRWAKSWNLHIIVYST